MNFLTWSSAGSFSSGLNLGNNFSDALVKDVDHLEQGLHPELTMAYWHWGSGLNMPCSLVMEVVKVVFEKCEEVNVAVMVVDQILLQ